MNETKDQPSCDKTGDLTSLLNVVTISEGSTIEFSSTANATDQTELTDKMEADEDEVEYIEEEDISGANKPGVSGDIDSESTGDPDYRRYEDPQDLELNDEYSSSSSASDDETAFNSQHDRRENVDDASSTRNNSEGQENRDSCEGSSNDVRSRDARSFYSKRTAQQSTSSYNFKLMTQELSSGQSKFMENFDPERSNREKRKLTRKTSAKKATLYDDAGLMGPAQLDICDCMNEACPGCHFPCPKCFSNKCGHECRQNRRWMYEEIFLEGTDTTILNPLYSSGSTEPL